MLEIQDGIDHTHCYLTFSNGKYSRSVTCKGVGTSNCEALPRSSSPEINRVLLEHGVDQLRALGIVTLGPVVVGDCANTTILWRLASRSACVWAGRQASQHTGTKVDQDDAGNIAALFVINVDSLELHVRVAV